MYNIDEENDLHIKHDFNINDECPKDLWLIWIPILFFIILSILSIIYG